MLFKKGDRIFALDGVCKGSFGVVTGHGSPYIGSRDDILHVRYDHGRTDSIFARMLELVEDDPLNID